MTDLAKLVVKLEAQTAQYMTALERAERKLDRFNRASSVSARRIAAGLTAAAVAGATAFAAMGKAAIDNADNLYKMSQQAGVSTESLSQLEHAANLSDVSLDQLGTSLAKLNRTAVDAARGSTTAARAFEEIGVAVQDSEGRIRDTEEILLDVADSFARMEDGAGKAATAQALFGRSGAQLIPFLNQGRAGLEAMKNEAHAFGLTVTEEAGAAAEQFNDNLTRLQAQAKGLVNKFVESVLPTLVAISERFVGAAQAGGALDFSLQALSVTFKTLVSAGVIVKSVFEQLGRLIYGVGAALVEIAHGDFRDAGNELTRAFEDAKNNVTDDIETIAMVWDEAVPQVQRAAYEIDEALGESLIFNDEKAEQAAENVRDSAISALMDLEAQLAQQVATFGKGELAVIQYRLAHGDLADQIRQAGPEYEILAVTIESLTMELEDLKAQEEAIVAAQSDWNEMMAEGQAIAESVRTPAEEYADTIERLGELVTAGAIGWDVYYKALGQARDKFDEASEETNKFLEEANRNVQDILGEGIETAISDGVKEGAKGALDAFFDMLTKMAIQAVAANLAEKMFGSGGVGSGGGWFDQAFGFLGKWFGGSRDSGGRGQAGGAYLIGTGAQPEMFMPDRSGTFIPAGAMAGGGSQKVTQNIYVAGPVTQRTARQMELESGRKQRAAAARLG